MSWRIRSTKWALWKERIGIAGGVILLVACPPPDSSHFQVVALHGVAGRLVTVVRHSVFVRSEVGLEIHAGWEDESLRMKIDRGE